VQLPETPATWATQIGALLGVGGLGAILLKVIERLFARADRTDDLAVGLRAEMVRRLESLERSQSDLERRERETFRKAVRLEAENVQLRRRYHDLINWIAMQPDLPQPPKWLFEVIDGPTQRSAQPAFPPEVRPSSPPTSSLGEQS
jgi:hypothetical protein